MYRLYVILFALLLSACHSPLLLRSASEPIPTPSTSVDAALPDTQLTPGATFAVDASQVCQRGYSAAVRNVPLAEKKEVFRRYRTTYVKGQYEVDHLISLELGGSNEVTNLWPEPYAGEWNAKVKDRLENRLHRLVCKGELPLATAQQAIAHNWVTAYQQYCANPQDCPAWEDRLD